jgi:hypothetical protein
MVLFLSSQPEWGIDNPHQYFAITYGKLLMLLANIQIGPPTIHMFESIAYMGPNKLSLPSSPWCYYQKSTKACTSMLLFQSSGLNAVSIGVFCFYFYFLGVIPNLQFLEFVLEEIN